jgi:LytS/YehU family sensor histidine kinase
MSLYLLALNTKQRQKKHLYNLIKSRYLDQTSLIQQLNPHFLFNAIVQIQYNAVLGHKEQTMQSLTALSRYMRKTLNHAQLEFVTIAEEIEHISAYFELEKYRYPDSIQFQVSIDPNAEILREKIPALLFQPFLEERINYGRRKEGKLDLQFSGFQKGDFIYLHIDDNIKQVRHQAMKDNPNSAMKNARERIKVYNKLGGDIKLSTTQLAGKEGSFNRLEFVFCTKQNHQLAKQSPTTFNSNIL